MSKHAAQLKAACLNVFLGRPFLAALLTLALFATVDLHAQMITGQITGDIVDASGAAVPDAIIMVTSDATGIVTRLVTTSTGHYTGSNLIPGSYSIGVSRSGFRNEVRTNVVVSLATVTTLNISLLPGSTSETITVTSDALTVGTDSAEIGTVVTPQEVTALPLSVGSGGMRNAQDFIFLTPGTYGIGTNGGDYQFSLAGGQQFGSQNIVDGIPFQALDNGDGQSGGSFASIDALEEFKVLTSGFPAEYGNTTGGVQSYVTKSGTNSFHGTVYDIFRNTALDANTWFNDGYAARDPANAGLYKRAADTKNEYGLTFGGPVWIPKLYDGRKKTFFFFSWEQFHQNMGATITQTVPTLAMRAGDFRSTLTNTSLGTNPCDNQPIYQGEIFDPQTTQTVDGQICRDPFFDNQIAPERISTVAKNLLKFYPNPTNDQQNLNYTFATSFPFSDTSYTIRLDHQFSPSDSVFASYTYRGHSLPFETTPSLPEPADPTGLNQTLDFNFLRLAYSHTFSPETFNAFRIGWTHSSNLVTPPSYGQQDWDSVLGISGLGGPNQTFPTFTFGESLTSAGDSGLYLAKTDIFTAVDSLTLVRGNHTVTLGGEVTVGKEGLNSNGLISGDFAFARAQTAATQSTILQAGNGFASFLLGAVGVGQAYNQLSIPYDITHYNALYVQDQYKATKSLSLSLGVRWDVPLPYRNAANNDNSNFSPTVPNAGAGGLPGALIFTGKGTGSPLSSRFADTWYKDVGPRVGLSWAPDRWNKRTVIHAFYGIIYGPLLENASFPGAGFTASSYLADFDTNGFAPAFNIDQGYPPFPQTLNLDPTQLNQQPIGYISREEGRPAMLQSRSLELQQQLANDLILTVGYLGSHGTHLRSGDLQDFNGLRPQFYGLGNVLNQPVDGTNLAFPYPGFSGTVSQALRPYPQYLDIGQFVLGNIGSSYYDSFYAKVERRFKDGLSLLGSYTWSKSLNIGADSIVPGYSESYGGVQNPFDIRGDKSLAQNNTPQMLVVSYVYRLPFGKNQRLLSSGRVVNAVVGDWQLSAIHRYMSGQAASVFGGCATSIPSLDSCIRYNRVPGQAFYSAAAMSGHFDPFTESKLNPAAITDPNANVASGGGYGFGDLPRVLNDVRSGAYLNEDVSLQKVFTIQNERALEFRFEAFNVFNRHVFALPDTGLTDPTFGMVTYMMDTPRQLQATLRIRF